MANTNHPQRRSLADELVEIIAGDIMLGRYGAGDALATEFQLGQQHGVSRTVVRETIARLQRSGLVHARQGVGTIVLCRDYWRDLDPELLRVRASRGLVSDLVPDLLAVRRIIEIDVAGRAALERTESHISQIARLLDEMHTVGDSPKVQTDLDIEFHEALIRITGNRLMLQMMQPINELRRIGSIITTSSGPDVVANSIAGHTDIFTKILNGDEAGARIAMAAHLERFEQELSLSMANTPYARYNAGGGSI